MTAAQGRTAVEKRAVCWLDIFVFAIFVTAGFWSLSAIELLVHEQRRELTPVREDFEHRANVAFLQAGSTMAQEELKILQNKLFDMRIEATRMAADLQLRGPNPRVLTPPQREQRIKLETTQSLIRTYEAQVPKKMQMVAKAAAATYDAKHSAELAYDRKSSEFNRETKILVLTYAAMCWAVLVLITWSVCAVLRNTVGHGSALHVLLPGSVLIVLSYIYYGIK